MTTGLWWIPATLVTLLFLLLLWGGVLMVRDQLRDWWTTSAIRFALFGFRDDQS